MMANEWIFYNFTPFERFVPRFAYGWRNGEYFQGIGQWSAAGGVNVIHQVRRLPVAFCIQRPLVSYCNQ